MVLLLLLLVVLRLLWLIRGRLLCSAIVRCRRRLRAKLQLFQNLMCVYFQLLPTTQEIKN
jgi:hypothetical protein